MNNPVEIIVSPFEHDGDEVRFCIHGRICWFETDYETLSEVESGWVVWAAKQIKASK